MRPRFPSGPATRSALYVLGMLAALKALSLVLMGQAVASLLAGLMDQSPAWGGQLAWGLAGVILRSLTVWAQAAASRRAALGVKEELRSQLLELSLRSGTRQVGPSDGGLAILATRGLDALDSYYTQFLPALVNCAAIPLLLGARILFADWISAAVIVLTVPLVPLFMILIGRYTEERVREAQFALARLSSHMLELAKGLPVLVGLGRAAAQRKALEDISEEYRSRTMGALRTAFLSALALELIATISVAVVAVFIGVRLVNGDMGLEAGLLALILAPDCYLPLRELGTAHHASDEGRAALAETTAVLSAPEAEPLPTADSASAVAQKRNSPEPMSPSAAAQKPMSPGLLAAGPGTRPAVPPAVSVTGLAVRYGGRTRPAVGPLSFTAAPGKITALTGASGTGKSTVLGVLAGTIGAGGGTTVSGRLEGFSRADLAWVPQHPVMVAATVLDEVRLYLGQPVGQPEGQPGSVFAGRPAEEADDAARRWLAACAAGHLAGKHPAELSPGELRRVALARGLARIDAGATVLLLDEPTAHLDRESAEMVSDAISALRGQVTVLLVAHDPQTRGLADDLVPVTAGTGTAPAARPAVRAAGPVSLETGLPATQPESPFDSAPEPVPHSQPQAPAARPDEAGRNRLSGAGYSRGGDTPRVLARDGFGAGAVQTSSAAVQLRRLLAPVTARFAAAGAVGTLAALFAVALAGLSGWLIIRAAEQPPILYLLTAIVGVRFFGVGRATLRYAERLLLHDAVFAALTRLRGRLWESLSRRALSLRRLLQGGNVLGAVVDDVDTVRELLPRVVLPPLTGAAVAAAALTATGLLLPAALPAMAVAALLSLVAAPALALAADRMSAGTEQRLRSGVLRSVAAALDARAELHANGVSAPVLAAITRADRSATAASQRSAWAEGLGQGLTALACGAAALASAVLAAPLALGGAVEPPIVAVVVLLQLALVEPYGATTTAVRQYPALRAVLRRISEAGVLAVLDHEPAAEGTGGLLAVPVRPGGRAGIRLRALSAGWPGGPDVFAGLTATAEPGRWLTVTGASGSGKSTLLAALMGFVPARRGDLSVSGRVAWCPQEAHLFDSTIRGNLMLGLPARAGEDPRNAPGPALEQKLQHALAAVGLGPLLARLESSPVSGGTSGPGDGLDTRIGPGGAYLSGGERQRLAVARTLLTGADVILLDEPTAHLDAGSGHALLAELRHGLKDRTVVLVTHNPEDIDAGDSRLDLDRDRYSDRGSARHSDGDRYNGAAAPGPALARD